MTPITLEAIKERHAEISAMITQFEEDAKKPTFFEYQGERTHLKQGEVYVGTITTPGEYGSYHLILIPGDVSASSWTEAMKWAEEQGGELPNRVEGALLFATCKSEFEGKWYWTRETHVDDAAYAWYQYFDYGYQSDTHKVVTLFRARAVRRLIID